MIFILPPGSFILLEQSGSVIYRVNSQTFPQAEIHRDSGRIAVLDPLHDGLSGGPEPTIGVLHRHARGGCAPDETRP